MAVAGEALPVARLLIQTAHDPRGPRSTAAGLWLRLREGLLRRTGAYQSEASLEIEDLLGRPVLAMRGVCPPVEVALPPGTYHVGVKLAGVQRRYSVTLESGAVLKLQVSA